MTLVIAIVAMLTGALFAFAGWRFLLLLPLWGLFVGLNVGTHPVPAFFMSGTGTRLPRARPCRRGR